MAISTAKSVAEETSSCTAAVASLSTAIQVRWIGFTNRRNSSRPRGELSKVAARRSRAHPFAKNAKEWGTRLGYFRDAPPGLDFLPGGISARAAHSLHLIVHATLEAEDERRHDIDQDRLEVDEPFLE